MYSETNKVVIRKFFEQIRNGTPRNSAGKPLVIIIGVPGSGKTSLARAMAGLIGDQSFGTSFKIDPKSLVAMWPGVNCLIVDSLIIKSQDLNSLLGLAYTGRLEVMRLDGEVKIVQLEPKPIIITSMSDYFPEDIKARALVIELEPVTVLGNLSDEEVENWLNNFYADWLEENDPQVENQVDLNLSDFSTNSIIRHKSGGPNYIVHDNFGDHAVAVRIVDITNPDEWEIVYNAKHRKEA